MTTITTRAIKGSALTHTEVDANFNNLNTAKLELNGSGNLGIGTASPASKLHVVGDIQQDNANYLKGKIAAGTATRLFGMNATDTLYIGSIDANHTGGTLFVKNGTTQMALDASGNLGLGVTPSAWGVGFSALQVKSGGAALWSDGLQRLFLSANVYYDGTNRRYQATGPANEYVQNSGAHSWYNAASGTAGNAITFTQAMTLDASGNLLVGTTAQGQINSNSLGLGPTTTGGIDFNHLNGTAGGIMYARFNLNAVAVGSITQSGTTAVLYNTTSDQRLKENIQDAPDAAELIDSIQVRSFDWISDGSHQRYGMVAQELVQVAPEAVHAPADPDDMMAVDYSKLVPMLIKEVQSLRARVAQLEAQ
jgi:hypothetical protein